MRVSVIIPAYRAAGTIGRAVESVLRQTHPAFEILVVDDGSPDDLSEALSGFGGRVTLLRKPNGGAASARNLGIDRATGDLIAFLDADDYWEPQKLERHVATYERNPELGLTCSRSFEQLPGAERREQPRAVGVVYDEVLRPAGREAFEWAMRVWTGTVVVRRSVLGAERFVSGLEPAEDRHLWVRLVLAAPVCFLSEPLATAVLETGSLSRSNVDRDCGNMLRVVQAYRGLLGWSGCRHWESHTYFRWGACEANPRTALRHLGRSLLLWPLPYRRGAETSILMRFKALTLRAWRVFRQRSGPGAPAMALSP